MPLKLRFRLAVIVPDKYNYILTFPHCIQTTSANLTLGSRWLSLVPLGYLWLASIPIYVILFAHLQLFFRWLQKISAFYKFEITLISDSPFKNVNISQKVINMLYDFKKSHILEFVESFSQVNLKIKVSTYRLKQLSLCNYTKY